MSRLATRPFVKVVTLSNQDHNVVFLHDSQGSGVSVNYIQVESVSGGGSEDGLFSVVPFPAPTVKAANEFTEASGMAGEASGSYGGAAAIANGQVVMSVAPQDAMAGIRLSHTTSNPVMYAITYGVVTATNTQRDGAFDVGR